VTQGMVNAAIRTGDKYYDLRNGSISNVLSGGFASGRSLVVATNADTGVVSTVITPRSFNPLAQLADGSPRYIPVP
jgi:hypothetical protein